MQFLKLSNYILVAFLLLTGCSSSGTGTEGGGEEPEQYTLSVSTDPIEGGSVDPATGTYEEGTQVSVEAMPSEGWKFIEWSGDHSSTNNPLSFTITRDTDITANFEETITSYSFNASASPLEAGTVSPQDTIVEEGSQLTVEAMAESGWKFTDWSGDTTSIDNPLTFIVTDNTSITSNFEQLKSEYSFSLTVEDTKDSIKLAFGQTDGATNSFDSGIDTEAPPSPPEGALNAFFDGPDRKLLDDFRSSTSNNLTWTLNYQIGSGDKINLFWSLDETTLNGSVTLTDSSSSLQVNMLIETGFSFYPSEYEKLIIIYEVGN